jgi:hypothetical protein
MRRFDRKHGGDLKMAALANIYTKVMEKHPKALQFGADAASHPRSAHAVATADGTFPAYAPLRAFANEDIYFYVKHIDNSGVVRAADPRAGRQAWKMIGGVGIASVSVIGMLLAGAYGLLAGYRIQDLQKEHARLAAERSELDVQSLNAMPPSRMEKLAREQFVTDPSLQKLVYLDGAADGQTGASAVASAKTPASAAPAKR